MKRYYIISLLVWEERKTVSFSKTAENIKEAEAALEEAVGENYSITNVYSEPIE